MVFDTSVLNRVYNLVWVCPKQGIQFRVSLSTGYCLHGLIWFSRWILFVVQVYKAVTFSWICSTTVANIKMALKQKRLAFCPMSSRVVPNKACILGFFCPKPGQGSKPSAAHPLTQILVKYPPPPPNSPHSPEYVDVRSPVRTEKCTLHPWFRNQVN